MTRRRRIRSTWTGAQRVEPQPEPPATKEPDPKAAAGWAWAEGWGNGYSHSNYRNPYPEGSQAAEAWEKGTKEGRSARAGASARRPPGEDAAGAGTTYGYTKTVVRGPSRSADAKLLGVDDDCTDDALRTAYRSAVFANHPDRGGSEERLKAINAAFERMRRARARGDEP